MQTRRSLLGSGLALTLLPAAAAWANPGGPVRREALELASVHAVVLDLDRGETLFAKNSDLAVPIASVTKLLTAVVVLDGGQRLDEWLEVVDWDPRPEKNAYSRMRIGSRAQRGDLLRVALMSSENLATHVLAHHYPGGRDAFVAAMNDKAQALGMSASQFVDPAGLSVGNRASAADLGRLVRSAWTDYGLIRDFSTGRQYTLWFKNPRYALNYGNTNPLVASGRWEVGLSKTGYLDEAGRCLALVTRIDGAAVAMLLLNSFGTRTPLGDAARVRRWLQTGTGGGVAGPARDYERRVRASLGL